ncbi:MAG: NAD+ synthase [Candidatus Omnitrophota bacterium]|jgi:NAD+ synthase (glutamine-hydrolysing)
MKSSLRIAISQINQTVGDLDGNLKKMSEHIRKAASMGCDIVAFPELAITGYPPEDLLHKEQFVTDNLKALKKLAGHVNDITVVAGFVDRKGKHIYNAAAVIYKKEIKGIYHKMLLPNYGVFDEKRYFTHGEEPPVFKLGGYIFGVSICEDMWHRNGPTRAQAAAGAQFIININASPYHVGKTREREETLRPLAKQNGVYIVYANLTGGQDELVFDGQSMVIDKDGEIMHRLDAFKEDLFTFDLEIPLARKFAAKKAILVADKLPRKKKPAIKIKECPEPLAVETKTYRALVMGLEDYVKKNGFKKVVIGLSGGIDSSLVAALAVDALGKENVNGIFMPSQYSSIDSKVDAERLASNLGINFMVVSVQSILKMYLLALEPHFTGKPRDITEENLQARIRGNILMAFSNKFGWMVLTTGNKSEMSTGYATLYGDMAGGFAVIKDVPKMLVYKLCRYRNSISRVIPDRVFTKAPTAELRMDQKDSDTLPSYETLDPILKAYIEEDEDANEIVASGFDRATVLKVSDMVDKSEYKRRQSPPGIKITPKAFGKDRRMPITNRYK